MVGEEDAPCLVGTLRLRDEASPDTNLHFSHCPCFFPPGSNYYVRILSTIDRELLKPNASVALHKHSNALVDVLPPEADSSIMMLTSGKGICARVKESRRVPSRAGGNESAIVPQTRSRM